MSRALLHPIALASIALLLLNDHYLKLEHPSWVTGKLSDVAGLVVFPLVLAALTRMPVAWAAAATAIVFALVKVVPAATDAYRHGLGILQVVIGGDGRPVEAVTDPTDLVALPAVLVALVIARSRGTMVMPWRARSRSCDDTQPSSCTASTTLTSRG